MSHRRLPIGVDIARCTVGNADHGRRLLGSDGSAAVVCPSRFVERKGQLDLIRAFRRVVDNGAGDNARLYLLGTVNSASVDFVPVLAEEVARLGLTGSVEINTEIAHREMPHVLAAADIVVQPSHYEGLGFSAIEAMAAGRPAVLTDVDGFQEFTRHEETCLVVPARDSERLADAILRLLNDRATASALGRAASAFARADMDSLKHVDGIVAEFAKIQQSPRRG